MFVPSFFSGQPSLILSTMRTILLALPIALLTLGASAQCVRPMTCRRITPAAPAPGGKLDPVLDPAQLQAAGLTQPWQARVYAIAGRIPRVLYQLPCNCRCDRALGHASLLSCFTGTHGGECSTCAQEGVYAYHDEGGQNTPNPHRDRRP